MMEQKMRVFHLVACLNQCGVGGLFNHLSNRIYVYNKLVGSYFFSKLEPISYFAF
jgi:hypothetical protein